MTKRERSSGRAAVLLISLLAVACGGASNTTSTSNGGMTATGGTAGLGGITAAAGTSGPATSAGTVGSGGVVSTSGTKSTGGTTGGIDAATVVPCSCEPFIADAGSPDAGFLADAADDTGGTDAGNVVASGKLTFEAWSKADRSDLVQRILMHEVSTSNGPPFYGYTTSFTATDSSYQILFIPKGEASRYVRMGAVMCGETALSSDLPGGFVSTLNLVNGMTLIGAIDNGEELQVQNSVFSINLTHPQNVSRICFRQPF